MPLPNRRWRPAFFLVGAICVLLGAVPALLGPETVSAAVLIRTIPAGDGPFGLSITPDGQEVYVANRYSSTVSVFDTATSQVVANISVGPEPLFVLARPDAGLVYVSNRTSDSSSDIISIIDRATRSVSATIQCDKGSFPHGMAYSPSRGELYVAAWGLNQLQVVDLSTGLVTHRIPVGSYPYAVGYSDATDQIYVANYGDDTVSVISASTREVVGDPIPVGHKPHDVEVSLGSNRLYVANGGGASVSAIDLTTNTVVANVSAGEGPKFLAVNQKHGRLYVSNNTDVLGTVTVVDEKTLRTLETWVVGSGPRELAVSPHDDRFYVAVSNANGVGIVADPCSLSLALFRSYGLCLLLPSLR